MYIHVYIYTECMCMHILARLCNPTFYCHICEPLKFSEVQLNKGPGLHLVPHGTEPVVELGQGVPRLLQNPHQPQSFCNIQEQASPEFRVYDHTNTKPSTSI